MKKKFSVLLAFVMVLSFSGGVFASSGLEKVMAYLNKDVKVMYNGELQTFMTEEGLNLYPLTYNGTTYLPVRHVAKLVDLPVAYNADTKTVLLGSENGQAGYRNEQKLHELAKEKYSSNFKIINDKKYLDMGGASHKFGFDVFAAYGGAGIESPKFKVQGYSELSFSIYAPEKWIKIIVKDGEGSVIDDFKVEEGETKPVTMNIADKEFIYFVVQTETGKQAKGYIYDAVIR